MELDLDDDLLAFRDSLRRLGADRFGPDVARRAGGPEPLDRARWAQVAATGALSLDDLGPVALVVAHEELGRCLVPGPVIATAMAGGVVAGAAEGTRIVTAVEGSPGVHPVTHLDAADDIVRFDGAGVWRLPRLELAGATAEPLDPTSTVDLVELPQGELVADVDVAASCRTTGWLLVAAHLIGSSAAATELAVDYAGERVQFGRRIGSFQAVKHLLADSHARTEVARAALHAAAVAVAEPGSGDVARLVGGARVLATAAGVTNARTAIQVHGGMGFTWEVDAHLHLKRCWALASAFGSAAEAAGVVADRLLEPAGVR